MKRFSRIAIALVALAAAGSAGAADLSAKKAPVYKAPPVVPVYNWSGFYVGVNAGGAWGRSNADTSTVFSPVGYFATSSVPAIAATGAQSIHSSGFTGGAQAGYNWQTGPAVFGVEVDFNYLGLKGSTNGSALYPCCAPTGFTINSSISPGWLFTARPRLGYAADNWLVYVTGGLAVARIKGDFTFTDTFATALETASISTTKTGWTVGAGAEVGLQGPWSLKVEYLYVNLGSVSTTSTNLTAFTPPIAFPTNVFTHSMDLKANIVRVGLNYRFGGPVVASY
jgi:outer membrane immunogenic protein